jgi:hypothetical protein
MITRLTLYDQDTALRIRTKLPLLIPRQRAVFLRDPRLLRTAGMLRPSMHLPPLLTPEAGITPTVITHHKLRALPLPRPIDLRLREQLTTRLVRAPRRVLDAVLGLLLRVAQRDWLVEVADDRREFDGLGAAAGREGAAIRHAGAETGVETLAAEDVAAWEGDGHPDQEVVVAPVALLSGRGGGVRVGKGVAAEEEVDLVDGGVYVSFGHFLGGCFVVGHAGDWDGGVAGMAVRFACCRGRRRICAGCAAA